MTARRNKIKPDPKKPPPAEKQRLSPRMQKLLAFVCDARVAWLIAAVIIAIPGLTQAKTNSETYDGQELHGSIRSARWSLTIVTTNNTGELTLFSDMAGFSPVGPQEFEGQIHRGQKLTSARWPWSHEGEGALTWNGNGGTNWSMSAYEPVSVIIEYDTNGSFIFYMFSFACVAFWIIALITPSAKRYFSRFDKRPAPVTQKK